MDRIRGAVVCAAVGFGLEPERLRPLGGRSGSAWSDGDVVLRVGERVDDEVVAASAAAGHLPVPRVLDRLELDGVCAVLLDDGEPTGVIDWANAAAGDPELDRARTWSLLTLDPGARELDADPGWATLTDHWLQAGRMHLLSASARSRACSFMLADLATRHTWGEPAHIRHAMRLAGATSTDEHRQR